MNAYHRDHEDERTRLKAQERDLERERRRAAAFVRANLDALQATCNRPSDDFEGCVE